MFLLKIFIMLIIIAVLSKIFFPKKEKIIMKEQEIKKIRFYDHKTFPHALFYGPAGIGKTTLARVIANDLACLYNRQINFHVFTPATLSSVESMFTLVKNIQYGDVVFIDEIHGLQLELEESLYGIMQDWSYFYCGQNIEVPRFTLLGATTLAGRINKPLRDRFTILIELDQMSINELSELATLPVPTSLKNYSGQDKAKQLIKLHLFTLQEENVETKLPEIISEVACRSLGNPRIMKQILFHVNAYQRLIKGQIQLDQLEEIFDLLGVDKNGLHKPDRRVLKVLINSDRPIGVGQLATDAGISKDDLEQMVEPRLLYNGLLIRTSRGRLASKKAIEEYDHL